MTLNNDPGSAIQRLVCKPAKSGKPEVLSALPPDPRDQGRFVRIGAAEDVAQAVGFFLSEGASFITGQTLYVCGGTSVGSVVI